MIRIERHSLGPRVYVLGRRIHEVAAGGAVLAVLLCGGLAEQWELTRGIGAAASFGAFLVVKDWRDLFPTRRDTARWGPLVHRVPRGSEQEGD